jgi:DNA-binding GntR family transcriptional regulator
LGVHDFGNGCEGFVQVILPKDIGEKLPLSEITGPLIIEKMEAAALETMKGTHQSTWAETASSKIAKRLGLEPGHTMLVVRRVYFAKSGRPLEVAINHTPAV